MKQLDPTISAEVAAHCRRVAAEIGQALGRAFGLAPTVQVESAATLDFAELKSELTGPGLAILLSVEGSGAAVVIAQKNPLLPPWYAAPDAVGQSKLTTLAQELGMLALPEPFLPDDFRALPTADLAGWLRQGVTHEAAAVVKIGLAVHDQTGAAYLIWPLVNLDKLKAAAKPAAVHRPAADESTSADEGGGPDLPGDSPLGGAQPTDSSRVAVEAEEPSVGSLYAAETLAQSTQQPPADAPLAATRSAAGMASLHDLPLYTRSLLKIRVPLSVTLAAKKQPVGQILEIGPGSIVQFDKSCEEMLDLNVSNLPIARGEAVKVGDKFGLRVTSLILPGERFKPVRPEA